MNVSRSTTMTDDRPELEDFTGVARLFPLPNVVLFPHVVQPLHIFEPRYRQMTADALAGDRLIAMVLLRPGWEADYEARPALHSVACLGHIGAEQQLPDGRYNLLLRGLSRARIVAEVPTAKLYRSARVELLGDETPGADESRRLRRELGTVVMPWLPEQSEACKQIQQLLDGEVPLGVVCDALGFVLPLPVENKQHLLEELEVSRRVRALLSLLSKSKPPSPDNEEREFPPGFSSN
jgi:Lon protease-like protein